MTRIGKRARNAAMLIGLLLVSFVLYAAAESGSASVTATLLGVLAGLMVLIIINR